MLIFVMTWLRELAHVESYKDASMEHLRGNVSHLPVLLLYHISPRRKTKTTFQFAFIH